MGVPVRGCKTSVGAAYSVDGIKVKTRRKARDEWLALKPGAIDGYVSWERFEAIRTMVAGNIPTGRHHGAPKHREALLSGLIRCRRCGRKLTLRYTGAKHGIPRYSCSRAWMDHGGPSCIAFGGLHVDDAIVHLPSPRTTTSACTGKNLNVRTTATTSPKFWISECTGISAAPSTFR
jgi:hypothetical protein